MPELSGTLSTDLVEREPPLECCCMCLSATGSLLTTPLPNQPNQDGTIQRDKLSSRLLALREDVPAVAEMLSAVRDGVSMSMSPRSSAAKPFASPSTSTSGCSGSTFPPTLTAASGPTASSSATRRSAIESTSIN